MGSRLPSARSPARYLAGLLHVQEVVDVHDSVRLLALGIAGGAFLGALITALKGTRHG